MSSTVALAIVGILGTLIGSFGGALIGARTSAVIARREAHRERQREERAVKAAARLVFTDLAVVKRTIDKARERREWWPFFTLPTEAWTRHAPTVAAELATDRYDRVAHAQARIVDVRTALTTLPVHHAGVLVQGAPRPLDLTTEDADELVRLLEDLVGQVDGALAVLDPLAYGEDETPSEA